MPRSLHLFAVSVLALIFCFPAHGQDTPSLGDVAKQAQKDKSNAPAKKVFTNDDFASSSGLGSSGPVVGSTGGAGRVVQPGAPGQPSTPASVSDELGRMEAMLNGLDSLDRATLAKNVLQGADTDFPGRAKWEEKLFAAKQVFVANGRDIMKRANQLQASAKAVQDIKNPNAKDLGNQLEQLVQEATRSGAIFEAVITEGKNLASQSTPH